MPEPTCEVCGVRITERAQESGAAREVGGAWHCHRCAQDLRAGTSSKSRAARQQRVSPPSTTPRAGASSSALRAGASSASMQRSSRRGPAVGQSGSMTALNALSDAQGGLDAEVEARLAEAALPSATPVLRQLTVGASLVGVLFLAMMAWIWSDAYFVDEAGAMDVADVAFEPEKLVPPVDESELSRETVKEVEREDAATQELKAMRKRYQQALERKDAMSLKVLMKNAAELKAQTAQRAEWFNDHEQMLAALLSDCRREVTRLDWEAIDKDITPFLAQPRPPTSQYGPHADRIDRYLKEYRGEEWSRELKVREASMAMVNLLTRFWDEGLKPDTDRLIEKDKLDDAIFEIETKYVERFRQYQHEVIAMQRAIDHLEKLIDRKTPWVDCWHAKKAPVALVNGPPPPLSDNIKRTLPLFKLDEDDYRERFAECNVNRVEGDAVMLSSKSFLIGIEGQIMNYCVFLPMEEEFTDFALRCKIRNLTGYTRLYLGKFYTDERGEWMDQEMVALGLTAQEILEHGRRSDQWTQLNVTGKNGRLTYSLWNERQKRKDIERHIPADRPGRLVVVVNGYGALDMRLFAYKNLASGK